ncbi:MAG: hypothetical protein OSB42_06130 [Planctomycetota bacterium]|nr:hypothetical protein [Planctomycetota bacterium]
MGITLAASVQALHGATQTAAHTQRLKIARELSLEMLGEIASGLWAEDLESLRYGTFASKDRPMYSYELALGDEPLEPARMGDDAYDYNPQRFDNWKFNRDRELEDNPDLADEESEEPFEKIRIRVSFPILPGLEQMDNFVEFERWYAWGQVYLTEDEENIEDAALPGDTQDPNAGGAGAGAGGGGGGAASPQGDRK